MAPEGWSIRAIEDIAKVTSGGTPNRANEEYWGGEIPWVTTAEIQLNTIYDTEQKITQVGLENSSAKIFPPDTILMAMYGQGKTRGQVAKLGINAATNQACAAILLKEGFHTDYYFQFLQNQYESIRNISNSGGQKNLSGGLIKSFRIPVPPFSQQKKIARILSTWDKAIETVEKLIENSKAQKKALMQQLLTGKQRLQGFDGEWKETTIKNIGKIISGGTPDTNTKEFWEGDILWMTPTDVTALKNRFISDTKRKITKSGVENSSATLMPKGSLLVCTRATVGLMSISTSEITTNQGFKSIIPNAKYDVDFLYYLFNFFKNKLISYACGSTFLELSKKDFSKLYFICPSLVEQQRIASVLSTADKEIKTLQQKLDCLKQEKKALMQQLLTGKRRVKVDR